MAKVGGGKLFAEYLRLGWCKALARKSAAEGYPNMA
jgi:hypothetical protein